MTPEFDPPFTVRSPDGTRLAVYRAGAPDAPVVHAVHGFASSAVLNWQTSGWVRVLVRAGFAVLAHDQRGHGASDAPHDPEAYTMTALSADAAAVQDAVGVRPSLYLGYSLGARVGWRLGLDEPERSEALFLGGMPLGNSMRGFDADAARAVLAGRDVALDRLTRAYLDMAAAVQGNDPAALIALADGLRLADPVEVPPSPPRLRGLAVGEDDGLLADNRTIAEQIGVALTVLPGRGHISAVTSRPFKDAVLAVLGAGA
ncbi:MAG: alpha/beta fold hydrolase [Mycetocola reblochoni]|uniref:Hydrolase n=2 Tax=Mycetocola reblochoni TaxID=331618 RepID=A0A1R4JIY4_9MICO|nr:alpha/beta hydrolase [Mycetocola reblochoni]RLP70545.1 alpha/beta hydrolase [Mycetocola reblochoni]SJN31977.1 Hydrolase [Mycetocola reblochoni REB411]